MKYKLEASPFPLVAVLRALMNPMYRKRSVNAVLDRTWEFRSLFSSNFPKDARSDDSGIDRMFENQPENPCEHFRVQGERLVERSALVWEFEETEIWRVSDSPDVGYDLKIWVDSTFLEIELNDLEEYELLVKQLGKKGIFGFLRSSR